MSDASAETLRRLFEREVPKVGSGQVEIVCIAREVGYRSKVAIRSVDETTDSVAACVGVRGRRIAKVIDAIDGERIDLVRWSEDPESFIRNALQPADLRAVVVDPVQHRATVFVPEDHLSFVTGKREANLRLASNLCGHEIVVETT